MSEYRRMMRALAAIPFGLLLLSGCAGPAYYGQAIKGHLAIMHDRQPIPELLAQEDLDEQLRRELELAVEIRNFASSRLGLPRNDSYTEFVSTGRRAVTWNVIATKEFSLQPERWCFPVAGCVPYRGYFSRSGAEKFAESQRRRSRDVIVSPAVAYSTLGWFDDPLLDTMLQYREERLAGFIFHELAHQQLYVQNDTKFNESYAGFLEEVGVAAWLLERGQDAALTRWTAETRARTRFDELLLATRSRLQREFESGHPEEVMRENKKSIYADMKVQYERLVRDEWSGTDYFASWLDQELNNARLALANSYQGGMCAFKNLYEEARGDMVRFQRMAAEMASLDSDRRTAWLGQTCEQPGESRTVTGRSRTNQGL
jgi:predicted aminopeptidase